MEKEKMPKEKQEKNDVIKKELWICKNPKDFKLLFDAHSINTYPFIEELYKGKATEVDEENKLVKTLIDNKIIVKE